MALSPLAFLSLATALFSVSPGVESSLQNAFEPFVDRLEGLQYSSAVRAPTCSPSSPIRYPTSTQDVLDIVNEAIANGQKVKAFGHRHSATDIICTPGIPIDMRGLKSFSYDPVTQRATIGAGVFMHDATAALRTVGRALRTTPAYGNITVGGAIGTGAHGSSLRYNSSISEQVVSLWIVDGTATLREISSPSDLQAFRIHLGLLGITVNATVDTVPLYKVTALNRLVPEDALLDGSLIDMVRGSDQISVYWFPSFKKLLLANWTIVPVETPGEAYTHDHVPPTYETFNAYSVPILEIIQTLNSTTGLHGFEAYTMASMYTTVPDFVPIYTEDGVTVQNPATGYYDVMFAPICNDQGFMACPWAHGPNNRYQFLDQEMGLDVNDLAAFAKDLKKIVAAYSTTFPLDGILMRFSLASDVYMSTAYGMDTVHFEYYMMKRKDPYNDPSLGLAAYQAILQTLTHKYLARSHMGKTGAYYHSEPVLDLVLDPTAKTGFTNAMATYDPQGIFHNNFALRLLGQGTAMDTDPYDVHCALLDDCICNQNSDCANGQICTNFNAEYNYRVCKDPYQLPDVLDLSSILALNPNTNNLKSFVCLTATLSGQLNLRRSLNCTIIG